MEIAYLHLVTNHIPIIGVPFALLILVWGLWRKSDEVKAAAFLLLALLGITTIGVYLLGQGGEDFVEDLAGVSHDSIEDHEEFALFALISVLIVGAASIFALVRYRVFRSPAETDKSEPSAIFPRWIVFTVLALALGSSAVLGYTGRLGGKIRHPEFHSSQTTTENGDEGEKENDRKRGRNRGGDRK